jgi:hypothetical protein
MGGAAGGRCSSACSASRTAVSSWGSRPAAQSCGAIVTSTSGSAPWFSADAAPRREGVQWDGVDDHRDERALLVGGQAGVDHAADGGGGRRLLGR